VYNERADIVSTVRNRRRRRRRYRWMKRTRISRLDCFVLHSSASLFRFANTVLRSRRLMHAKSSVYVTHSKHVKHKKVRGRPEYLRCIQKRMPLAIHNTIMRRYVELSTMAIVVALKRIRKIKHKRKFRRKLKCLPKSKCKSKRICRLKQRIFKALLCSFRNSIARSVFCAGVCALLSGITLQYYITRVFGYNARIALWCPH
jgi:hypothetical protein